MAEPGEWIEVVRRVISAVRGTDVTELELANGDVRLRLRRQLTDPRGMAGGEPPASAEPSISESPVHHVVAPLTGVFYRAASPAAKPFVAEGDWVDGSSAIGLIETMKIFNEVVAEHAGRVLSFTAVPGALVQAGDSLVTLELAARSTADALPQPGTRP